MTGNRILLVDDDADIREALGELLQDAGYTVVGAANGLEALTVLRDGIAPCVILLDLMMPVMDGYQFRAEQLRNSALASIPTIVITAGATVKTEDLGGVAVLTKPIRLDRLMSAIKQHCGGAP